MKGLFILVLTLGSALSKVVPKEKRSSVCYGDLGCYNTNSPFFSLQRPINFLPQRPEAINTRFMLYTRQNAANGSREFLRANDLSSIRGSNFRSTRKTKFVSHGFLENGLVDWMQDLKNALLKNGDYNVILVDWGRGSGPPYTQATANTRLVGAEIAKLVKVLQAQTSLRAQDVHIIGHSLGAHIAGYAGDKIPNLGRITGMDPAGPYFENTDPAVRLDPTDADFVDVIHTDGESLLKLGFGLIQAIGHVDYYPNSGADQPGCDRGPITQLRLEGDLYNGGKEFIACNHLRSYKYFTESINSQCPYEGYKCDSYSSFKRGSCMPCNGDGCGYMGFHADKVKPPSGQTHVKYFLETGADGPFCRYHYQLTISFGNVGPVREERGRLYVNLMGSNGQLGEKSVSDTTLDIQPGHTYGFVLTSTHDIGDLDKVSFRWKHDSNWYNPLTWRLLSHSIIQIKDVDIINGETQNRKKICAFNAQVETDVTRVFSQHC